MKMLPYTIIFSGFAVFINYLLYIVDGLPLNGNYLLIFGGQFVTIITYQLLGVMLIALTSNLRLSLSMGSAYAMMAITFSGLTFPAEGMPKFVRFFTALFPFTWWEKIMISQSLRGAPVREALPFLCYILIFWVVALCTLPRYKLCLSHPKYWGKL